MQTFEPDDIGLSAAHWRWDMAPRPGLAFEANDIGLSAAAAWSDNAAAASSHMDVFWPPLLEQLDRAGITYQRQEIPDLPRWGNSEAYLVFYDSPRTGRPTTVLCTHISFDIDAFAEDCFYFTGLTQAEALAIGEAGWLARYERCCELAVKEAVEIGGPHPMKTTQAWSVVCGFSGNIYSGHRTQAKADKVADETRTHLWWPEITGKDWHLECAIRRLHGGKLRHPDITRENWHSCGSLASYVQVVPAGSYFSRVIPADNDSGCVQVDQPRWVVPAAAVVNP
jgi:hypothetical protein